MAVSKVILNGTTLMDVTEDTVAANNLLSGETATGADGEAVTGAYVAPSFKTQSKSATPSETAQTITPDTGFDGLSQVSVGAVSSTYVGSEIARKSSTDLTANGATVSVPAGYYEEAASKSVATTTHPNPTASINSSTGVVTASHTQTAGYVAAGTTTGTLKLSTQAAKTVTPTESEQTAVAAGKYTTGTVKVGAISSTYVGSEVDRKASADLTANGPTVTVPAGYYQYQASKTVTVASAGDPVASKGTVSNNTISITPYVDNTTGYITGGRKTGTAVTVSASELVSGTKSITENGTVDVTNFASATVNVPVPSGYVLPTATKASATYVPTTTNQAIASGTYLTGDQTISGDANLVPENIADGVSIFGVSGTHQGDSGIENELIMRTLSGFYSNSTISKIGQNAFQACTGLTSINFENLTSIGNTAFFGCVSLSSIADTTNVTYVGDNAFGNCRSLVSVSFPNLTSIQSNCFAYCKKLTELYFPEVTSIHCLGPFKQCGNLSSLYFPKLTKMYYSNTAYSSYFSTMNLGAANGAFAQIYSLHTVNFPSCSTISPYAFYSCANLSTLILPEVTIIYSGAFASCPKLSEIDFSKVTSVGSSAFYSDILLQKVSLPLLKSIAEGTFHGCKLLSDIYMPSVSFISNKAFAMCEALENVKFDNVSSIYYNSAYTSITICGAFYSCSNLKTAIFPKLRSIPIGTFTSCINLSYVKFMSCASIYAYAFNGCSSLSVAIFSKSPYENGFIAPDAFWTALTSSASVYLLGTQSGYSSRIYNLTSIDGRPPLYSNVLYYVPSYAYSFYLSHSIWGSYFSSNIRSMTDAEIEELLAQYPD